MNWHSWSAAPFREAVDTARPVLLFVTTRWSRGCVEMERTTFADGRVAALVDGGFVPVRVDADLRPDIAERYTLGGWPSTLLLTEDGEILQGSTYLEAPALADLLARAGEAYRTGRAALLGRAAAARHERGIGASSGESAQSSLADLPGEILAFLLAGSDPAGGFAGSPKFLHEDAIVLFLDHGTAATLEAARLTLDAGTRVLCGPAGEFFRCAAGADWQDAVPEVTPESQAAGIRLLTEASLRFGDRYAAALGRAVDFARAAWLRDAALPTDTGAQLAAACLGAARVLDDQPLGRDALALLERVALATYRPGEGVRHFAGADAPVLLTDHVAAARALLDAHGATGQAPYAMLAEELGHRLLDRFLDASGCALRDRVHDSSDIGRMTEPLHPFRLNAHAAGVLGRLAGVSGDPRFLEAAAALLDSVASRWRGQGLDAAACGIAAMHLIDWRHS